MQENRRPFGNVLVGTDFSDGATRAVERAAHLPISLGSGLTILHVMSDALDHARANRMEAEATSRLETLRGGGTAATWPAGLEVGTLVQLGKPWIEIVRTGRHGKHELIVLGRHGERTFRELLLGSTVERVIRKGDVSVLVVGSDPHVPYRRPLVAIDFSDSSKLALELALGVSDPSVAMIDVVHVRWLPSTSFVPGGKFIPPPDAARDDETRATMEQFVTEVAPRARWNLMLGGGDPRRAILDAAAERTSDFIALGTHGRAGLAHALLGSVAEGVLRAARCDVLVARLPWTDFRLP